MLRAGQFEDVAFYCQQAAEKSANGFLAWHDVRFPKTHELTELAQLVAQIRPDLAVVILNASVLSPYVWEFRYPGSDFEATPELANQAMALARGVYEAVLSRIPNEAHPQPSLRNSRSPG